MEKAVAVVKTADGDIDSALRVVAENARSAHGRQALASFDAVPVLLSRLRICSCSSFCDDFSSSVVLLLRALRNLCAGEATNQDAFVKCSGIDLVASLACRAVKLHQGLVNSDGFDSDSEAGSSWLQTFKALLQLLGNVAARGEVAQSSIWDIFFPELFLDLACVSAEEVHEPLGMVLYNCFRTSGERRLQLAQGKGARVLAILLRDSESNPSVATNDWLSLVVEALCLNDEHFPVLFKNLGPVSASTQQAFSSEQAILLSMICAVLDDKNGASSSEKLPMPVNSMLFLVDIIEHAATTVGSTVSEKGISWPTGLPSSDVLGFSLVLGRMLCAYEAAAPDQGKLKKVSDLLASKGLLEHSLEMLRALGPPELVRKAVQLDEKGTTEKQAGDKKCERSLSEMHLQEVADSLEQQPEPSAVVERFLMKQFPRQNPYKGYRRDIVAVIANMAFQNIRIQEQVRENGGLLLILQQCVVDEDNPYLREWGFWAVRNLTEGNAQNIQELANLELRKPVNTEEILKAGLKVEVDSRTRRPKLVNLGSAGGDKQQSSD